jgi:hypothetical protein
VVRLLFASAAPDRDRDITQVRDHTCGALRPSYVGASRQAISTERASLTLIVDLVGSRALELRLQNERA